jgi:hypothetical protein
LLGASWSIRLAIAILTLATAAIHLVLAIPENLVAFHLNAAGYLALLAAFLLPRFQAYRRWIRWLFMGYAALTVVLWIFLGQPYTTIGYVDKAVEMVLIVLLWLDGRQSEP